MLENPTQRKVLMGFFKTGPGQYGEGDQFLGLKVPETRALVREARCLPLPEVQVLLNSPWHEARLCGFLVLVEQFNRRGASADERECLVQFYLQHARRANNWDLVDMSCYKLLGRWLATSAADEAVKRATMDRLAASDCLWEQRIAMVSTLGTLMAGNTWYTVHYAEQLLPHPHDLMQKAVGWMLREMGKRCGVEHLRSFLAAHVHQMHRTTLRYAIERLEPEERQCWMQQ